ncbi:MAG: endonuclease/exonuclease/phosphatase family protein [Akkermansiaceae bacterium]|nr:endonuclease/exonuclease/phosphatase family protein [Armatimonadota bacterium]
MRLACLNIHAGRCGTGDNRGSLPAIAELLRSVSPDVCLLQEVDRRMPRSGFVDQAGRLARAMRRDGEGEWYFAFYGRLDFGPLGQYGNAILSREPIANIRRLPLSASGGEPRGAVGVTISGDTPIVIWTTHLGLRDEWRATQLTDLAVAVNADVETGYAVIVGGDFNALADAPEVAMFQERTGLVIASLDAPTFPATEPIHRIDFLFVLPERPVANSGVIAEPNASDHGLLWIDV